MSHEADQRLEDIVEACERVGFYIRGFDQTAFEDDAKTQDAVIRQFKSSAKRSNIFPTH